MKIKEYIKFGSFNTKDMGLYLKERDAPSPSEDEQVQTIPYRQGEEDFGYLTGERVFKQRKIKYVFLYRNTVYEYRKRVENDTKRMLMPMFNEQLIDTHDKGYYWTGKVESIGANDDQTKGLLTLTITFSLYPFAFRDTGSQESDVWDSFDFDNDLLQPTVFHVDGFKHIELYNSGVNSITPIVRCDDDFTLRINNVEYHFNKNKTQDYWLKLSRGKTDIDTYGYGTIQIILRQEIML